MRGALTLAAVGAAACGGSDPAIVVEVQGRPAVQGITSLEVTLSNEGATQTQTFDLSGETLPATFSITATGRTGPIGISARALDGALASARGQATVDAAADSAVLMLEPDDFVVNTELAGGQFLNEDIETNGFQLSAGGDVVTVGFRDDCPVSVCNLWGRRFGLDGRPLTTSIAAGTNQFRWNEIDGAFVAHVGVANQDDGSGVAVWDSDLGVQCRAIDAAGNADAGEIAIAADTSADVVSATPFGDGSFGVTWSALDAMSIRVIRTTTILPDCSTRFAPITAAGPVTFAHRPTYALTPRATLIAWIDSTEARFRIGTFDGVFSPPGSAQIGATLVSAVAPERIDFVRALGVEDGFVVVYRRSAPGENDTILMRRIDEMGAVRGADTVIASFQQDFGSPAIARREEDGALAVMWTQCDAADGAGCSVHGRLLRASGVPVGDPFVINTTTRDNQTDGSIAAIPGGFVAAFTDDSAEAPDISDRAVRLRYLYPAFDDARATIGARCTATSECGGAGALACVPDADGLRVCHATCIPGGPAPVCPGGGTCTQMGAESYCAY
jgi:hypothetical protein